MLPTLSGKEDIDTMRNPLNKRIPREIKSEFTKYISLFLFLAAMIAIVSGFLVANNSMGIAYDESFDKYNIEDGKFELYYEADDSLIEKIETECDAEVYENYYYDEDIEENSTAVRIYKERKDVDKICIMEGSLAETDNEIAIDRLYAQNNNYKIGDTINVDKKDYRITGFIALSDYSALFESNSDMMFDAMKFGVAVVTDDAFGNMNANHIHYSYSWLYNTSPKDDAEAKNMSDDFMESLNKLAGENMNMLCDYNPEYSNQAIIFTGDDMSGDNTMIAVFLYIVMIIISFMFVIIISNTITKESNVIGTLKASGYTNSELIRHYMTAPVIILIVAAVVGNILGYTWLKQIFVDQYYNSYSLTTYETVWNATAFIQTTVIPLIILVIINFLFLYKKFKLSALKFIRRDLKKKKNKKAFRLNTKIKIMTRFRLRIIFQNIPNYLVIFFGVFFANFIFLFGEGLEPMLYHYQDIILENTIADYQYILKGSVETNNENAEKYSVTSLKTKGTHSEDVSVYGITEDSKYIDIDFGDEDGVYISDAFSEKYSLEAGDTITLKEEYSDKEYDFKVSGVYYYPASVAIFARNSDFCDIFDEEDGYFDGYFSNEKLTDIDDMYIASTITEDDLTKTSRQLINSFGSMMIIYLVFGVVMFVLIIFILAKIIIENNTQSISMTKILGYNIKEINNLYILTTSLVVIFSLFVTLPLCDLFMSEIMKIAFSSYSGWLPYCIPVESYIKILATGVIAYIFVAFILMRKVNKIPLSEALKNVE